MKERAGREDRYLTGALYKNIPATVFLQRHDIWRNQATCVGALYLQGKSHDVGEPIRIVQLVKYKYKLAANQGCKHCGVRTVEERACLIE